MSFQNLGFWRDWLATYRIPPQFIPHDILGMDGSTHGDGSDHNEEEEEDERMGSVQDYLKLSRDDFKEKCRERNELLKMKIESIVTNLDDRAKLAMAKLMEKVSPKKGKRSTTVGTETIIELLGQFCAFTGVVRDEIQNLSNAVLDTDNDFWRDLVAFYCGEPAKKDKTESG